MDLLPALFGVACCLTVALARGGMRLLLSVLLAESWAISNIGWQWNMLSLFPVLDLVTACVGFAMWHETKARWLGVFTCIAASQLVLHAIYEWAGFGFQHAYLFLLNATFALELLVVSWRGMVDAFDANVRGVRRFLARGMGVHPAEAVIRG